MQFHLGLLSTYGRWAAVALVALLALWLSGQRVAGGAEEPTVWRTIPVVGGNGPKNVAVNPDTGRLYVTHVSNDLSVIDAASGQVLATLPELGSAMSLNRTTNRLYVASYYFARVSVVDLATNTVIAEIGIPEKASHIVVNAKTNRIYVNANEPKISVIDGDTNTVMDTIDQFAGDLAVDPTTNQLFVLDGSETNASSKLVIIDGTTDRQIGEVQVGPAAMSVDVDPSSGTVFVSTSADGSTGASQLWIVDSASQSVKKTIAVVGWVVKLGVNTRTHYVYAVQFAVETGSVSVFDAGGSLVKMVPTGAGATDVAVDEVHDLVYVLDDNVPDIAVIGNGPPPSSTLSPPSTPGGFPGGGGPPAADNPDALTLLASGLALTVIGAWLVLSLRRSR